MWLLSTFILYFSIAGIVKSSVDYLQHPVKPCHVGDVVENECNKCLCTSKAVFECTPEDCSGKSDHKEIDETEPLCYPNQLYVKNLITCICTKDGKWPHKSCYDTFQSLPPRNVITHKCEPNTYIHIDCNVCRCGPKGEIHNDRCTRNACEDDIHRRSISGTNTLYSKCEEKYWYSLAPCQFCFCVNQNKLVCNTGNYYTRNLDLGSYKLNVCGKELIKEAIELIPDNLRTLRMRPETTNNSIGSKVKEEPLMKPKLNKISANRILEINLNKEKKTNNKSVESYSDEAETEQQMKYTTPKSTFDLSRGHTTIPTTNSARITRMPNQEIEMTVEESGDKTIQELSDEPVEDDDDESVEIEVQVDPKPSVRGGGLWATPVENFAKEKVYKYDGQTLKINVPKALNKVFKMALRKSMVSLSKDTECIPGSTTSSDCNMCFCLKNSKLLCTNHKCVGGKKAN